MILLCLNCFGHVQCSLFMSLQTNFKDQEKMLKAPCISNHPQFPKELFFFLRRFWVLARSVDEDEYGAFVGWYWQRKTEVLGADTCLSASLSTTNLTWTDMGIEPVCSEFMEITIQNLISASERTNCGVWSCVRKSPFVLSTTRNTKTLCGQNVQILLEAKHMFWSAS